MPHFLDRVDPNFVKDVDRAFEHERSMARRLRKTMGPRAAIKVGVQKKRDHARNHHKFTDDGDLRIKGYRVEVKERKVNFTSKDDFPYPTAFVDTANSIKKGEKKPVVFFNESEKNPGAIFSIIVPTSQQHWVKKRKWCADRGRHKILWECPKEHLSTYEEGVAYLESLPMTEDPKFKFIDESEWWTEDGAETTERKDSTQNKPDLEEK